MRTFIATLVLASSSAPFCLTPRAIATHNAREVVRVQAHFDSVLVELHTRDVSALTRAQQEQRAQLISTLAAYRDRGRFPQNYDYPDQATPYFVDRKTGILCAVAHLLASTGRHDIVDRVAAANNNVWVPQLARDTAFTHWLDANGLTLNEAARIQVPYSSNQPVTGYAVGSAATAVVSIGATIWNVTSNRKGEVPVVSVVGVIAGATAISLGVSGAGNSDTSTGLNVFTIGAGTASVFTSVASLITRQHRANERRKNAQRERERASVNVSPTLSLANQHAAGVAVSVRF